MLTLAPIWLPHWPIWICTISRIFRGGWWRAKALCYADTPVWFEFLCDRLPPRDEISIRHHVTCRPLARALPGSRRPPVEAHWRSQKKVWHVNFFSSENLLTFLVADVFILHSGAKVENCVCFRFSGYLSGRTPVSHRWSRFYLSHSPTDKFSKFIVGLNRLLINFVRWHKTLGAPVFLTAYLIWLVKYWESEHFDASFVILQLSVEWYLLRFHLTLQQAS